MIDENLKTDYTFKRLAKEKEESWQNVCERLISELESRGCKTSKKDLQKLLYNFFAMPNSPALSTAGSNFFAASACSSYPVFDTLSNHKFSVLNSLGIASKALKVGIGVGFNFSLLRSKDETVAGRHDITEGPVGFLSSYDGFIGNIKQITRKPACMGLLHVNHPDILDFINAKTVDGNLHNFNISVVIDDEFMQAALDDRDYYQHYRSDDMPAKKVRAKELLDIICQRAWENGEPGIMFEDTIARDYFLKFKDGEKMNVLANPCFSEDTLITTRKGLIPVKELVGKEVEIFDGKNWVMVNNFRVTGEDQPLLKFTMTDGSSFKVTPNHTMVLNSGDKILASACRAKMSLKPSGIEEELLGEYKMIAPYLKGFLVGSGKVNQGKSELFLSGKFLNAQEDLELDARELGIKEKDIFVHHKISRSAKMMGLNVFDKELMSYCGPYKKKLPTSIFQLNDDDKVRFLAGFFDATAKRFLSPTVTYVVDWAHKETLEDIQMLLKTLGVNSKLTVPKKYESEDDYDDVKCTLKITQKNAIKLNKVLPLKVLEGFADKKLLDETKASFFEIKSIERLENAKKVYCCTVPTTNTLAIGNGIMVGNCSEALLSWDTDKDDPSKDWVELCVLASINLPKYIELSSAEREDIVRITVSMLNDIIDCQDYVCKEHELGMKKNRKIGVGVAGLATVLAIKGIKYSSDDAYRFTKQIFDEIGRFALKHSQNLVDVFGEVNNLGRANSSILSQAPTSSLASIFNYANECGCSYGIEPYFDLSYKINNSFGTFEKKEKIVDYLDGKIDHIESANQLDYKSHLRPVEAYYSSMLGEGVTQGCSKTVNFKNNVTVEEVKEALYHCWRNNIKAISFYRDGSRKNQMIELKDSYHDHSYRPDKIVYNNAPKRPEKLVCEIHRTQSKGQQWLVFVGLLNGQVYEVFLGLQEKVKIPLKADKGTIFKRKGKYVLSIGDKEDCLEIEDIPGIFESKEQASLSRLMSMALRHGIPLKFLIEQLLKDGAFDAVNRAVARVLKKYVKDDELVCQKCPECGLDLVYSQGCPTCKSCGFSKCS